MDTPQPYLNKSYLRWATMMSFVTLMAWLSASFYNEYRAAEIKKQHAINTIVQKVEENNIKVEEHNSKIEQHNNKVTKKKIIVKLPNEVTQNRRIELIEQPDFNIKREEKTFNDAKKDSGPDRRVAAVTGIPSNTDKPSICKDWREAAQGKCIMPSIIEPIGAGLIVALINKFIINGHGLWGQRSGCKDTKNHDTNDAVPSSSTTTIETIEIHARI